jgi:hypothetical protein
MNKMERSTKQQLWKNLETGERFSKAAELANTYDMPLSYSPDKNKTKAQQEEAARKMAADQSKEAFMGVGKSVLRTDLGHDHSAVVSVGLPFGVAGAVEHNPSGFGAGVGLLGPTFIHDPWAIATYRKNLSDKGVSTVHNHGTNPAASPQTKKLNPHVHVDNLDAPKEVTEKKASRFALPLLERYPLDDYAQVKMAAQYFEDFGGHMEPTMRREYCQNLYKRASELAIQVSPEIEKRAAEGYSSRGEFDAYIDSRKCLLQDDTLKTMLDKLAALRVRMQPEDFAITLGEFDKTAGLCEHYDRYIPDAYYTTFGKTASAGGGDFDKSVIEGSEYTNEGRIVELAKRHGKMLHKEFGFDFASEFYGDPMTIYNSMPRDQRLVIIRLANEAAAKAEGSSV